VATEKQHNYGDEKTPQLGAMEKRRWKNTTTQGDRKIQELRKPKKTQLGETERPTIREDLKTQQI